MTTALLRTKLYIPPPRPYLVRRPRLIHRLDEGFRLGRCLTLVSAPAGFGKTMLLSAWAANCECPVAWVSLDKGDNELREFLGYLVTALQTIPSLKRAGVGDSFLAVVQSPDLAGTGSAPDVHALMTDLINELAAAGSEPFLLVLDDFHLIESQSVHAAVTFLVDNLVPPAGMHLVLAGRADPPWPLARLRGCGEMTEVRADDLRFTAEEAVSFLNIIGAVELSPEEVAVLRDRTEGWVVGLQMAALAMRGLAKGKTRAEGFRRDGDVARFVDSFRGTHPFVLDYLVEEVLGQQPAGIQEFLLQTSILERMTGPLCDAVRFGLDKADARSGSAGAPGSADHAGERERFANARGQAILAQLEQANLFLIPLDDERRWYRYHHLFADLLNSSLRQSTSPEQIRELHRRASRWHEEHGSLEEAMVHAMAGQDFERAAGMLERNIATMMSRSEGPTLLRWIEKLPEGVVRAHPLIKVYYAYALVLSGKVEQVEPLLEEVEQSIEPGAPGASELLGGVAAVRVGVANLRNDAEQVIEMAAQAERHLPGEDLNARAMIAYTLADAHMARDEIDDVSQAALEMVRLGEKAGRLLLIVPGLCDLAASKKVQGRLQEARDLYDQAWLWMRERDALNSRVRCPYEAGMSGLLCEWNDLDAAAEHAAAGIEHSRRFGVYSYLVWSYLTLVRVCQARGDAEGVKDALRCAEQAARTHHIRQAATIALKAARVGPWLALGEVEMARRWAAECDGGSELEQIALARLWLAQGKADEAQRLLDRQMRAAEAGGRTGRSIEILGLQAVSLEALGQQDRALAALAQALPLAQPEGYVRVFLDLGGPIDGLLRRAAARGLAGDYVGKLLEALQQERTTRERRTQAAMTRPSPAGELALEPLTGRELEVLRLLAAGLSTKEIAQTLVIAPSTAKQHLKNIYGKLDVHSRIQAVSRAREAKLI